jgi:transposase
MNEPPDDATKRAARPWTPDPPINVANLERGLDRLSKLVKEIQSFIDAKEAAKIASPSEGVEGILRKGRNPRIDQRSATVLSRSMHFPPLTNVQWTRIQAKLPPRNPVGRPRADDRRVIDGILFVLSTGCRWQDLPRGSVHPTTCWRRFTRWQHDGTWRVVATTRLFRRTQGRTADRRQRFRGRPAAPRLVF